MDVCRSRCANSPSPFTGTAQTTMTNTTHDLRETSDAATSAPEATRSLPETGGEALRLPNGAVAVLPIRNTVLFPGIVIPLAIGRPTSLAAIQYAARTKTSLGVVLQRDAEMADPAPKDLHEIGTTGLVLRYVTA